MFFYSVIETICMENVVCLFRRGRSTLQQLTSRSTGNDRLITVSISLLIEFAILSPFGIYQRFDHIVNRDLRKPLLEYFEWHTFEYLSCSTTSPEILATQPPEPKHSSRTNSSPSRTGKPSYPNSPSFPKPYSFHHFQHQYLQR